MIAVPPPGACGWSGLQQAHTVVPPTRSIYAPGNPAPRRFFISSRIRAWKCGAEPHIIESALGMYTLNWRPLFVPFFSTIESNVPSVSHVGSFWSQHMPFV